MHRCDPVPNGGPITLARLYRLAIACADGDVAGVVAEFDDCPRCRRLVLVTLATTAAGSAMQQDPDARMILELHLAAAEAEIDK